MLMNMMDELNVRIKDLTEEERKELKRKILESFANGKDMETISEDLDLGSPWLVYRTLEKEGVLRNAPLQSVHKNNGWRKLVGVGKTKSSKIVSIPHLILGVLGFEKGEELRGKWIIDSGELRLDIKRPNEVNNNKETNK